MKSVFTGVSFSVIAILTLTAQSAYADSRVKAAQEKLLELGYKLGIADGIWGRNTEAALKQFLYSKGLTFDGALDANEFELLEIKNTGLLVFSNAYAEENSQCAKPFYDDRPSPIASDSSYRYYEFYWQDNPQLCINFRQPELLEEELVDTVWRGLNFAKDTLGLVTPVNAFIVDQKNASKETLRQISEDNCKLRGQGGENLRECIFHEDPWGNRFAAAGVDYHHFYNGGELAYFRDTWLDTDVPIRILMHEFYHVYQNSMKFYFEEQQRFGVRVQWQDNPETYLWARDRVTVFPNWIEEGGADFAGWALTAKFDPSLDIRAQMIEHLDEARAVVNTAADKGDRVSLRDYEYQAELYESDKNPNNGIPRNYAYAYTGGFMGLVYLWSLDEANFKRIMVDYYKIYAERDQANPGQGWKVAFEELFGMTMDEFYADFDAFMLKPREQQLAIIKPKDAWQSAPLK